MLEIEGHVFLIRRRCHQKQSETGRGKGYCLRWTPPTGIQRRQLGRSPSRRNEWDYLRSALVSVFRSVFPKVGLEPNVVDNAFARASDSKGLDPSENPRPEIVKVASTILWILQLKVVEINRDSLRGDKSS